MKKQVHLTPSPLWGELENPIKYQPKGSMCRACKNQLNNCSNLPFKEMPVASEKEDVVIVICTEFVREE